MNYLAIVTYGRTGSTVLQAILNQMEGTLIRGENLNIFRSFESSYRIALRIRKERGVLLTKGVDPWFGSEGIDPERLLQEQQKIAIDQVLRPDESTRYLGFKEIRYDPDWFISFSDLLDYLIYLDLLFPGIRFVVNRRDPIATSRSSWWRHELQREHRLTTAFEWMGNVPEYLNSRLDRPAAMLVEYEHWNDNPEALQPLWKFLGIDWEIDQVRRILSQRLRH